MKKLLLLCLLAIVISGCGLRIVNKTTFPSPDKIFITTGDGDIQKPYTPIGQLALLRSGWRVSFLPILGLLGETIDPDRVLREDLYMEIRRMGGDGLINMRIEWKPPKNGFIGLGATGGYVIVYGTVIKR